MATDPNWKPGDTSTLAPVACCPVCGSVGLQWWRGTRASNGTINWYECRKCKARYRMLERKIAKAIVIG